MMIVNPGKIVCDEPLCSGFAYDDFYWEEMIDQVIGTTQKRAKRREGIYEAGRHVHVTVNGRGRIGRLEKRK